MYIFQTRHKDSLIDGVGVYAHLQYISPGFVSKGSACLIESKTEGFKSVKGRAGSPLLCVIGPFALQGKDCDAYLAIRDENLLE